MDSTPPPGAPRQGQRMLAAIVFTDAVNFSARMQEDEERTLRLIERDFADMRELCQQHQGSVLKTTGDGLLLYFASAVQAVACALAIQRHFADIARRGGEAERLAHRVGIHLGDVFVSQQDVMGDGVNIASRLQAEAEPGGICISQTVYDVVKNKLELHVTSLGARELKNIAESIQVYRLLLDAQALHSRSTVESTAPVTPKSPSSKNQSPSTKSRPSPVPKEWWRRSAFRWATVCLLLGTLIFSVLATVHARNQLKLQRADIQRQREIRTAIAEQAENAAHAGRDIGEFNNLQSDRRVAQQLRSQYLDKYNFAGLVQFLNKRVEAGTPAESVKAIRISASQMRAMRDWVILEMQRYNQANPLVTRELSGAAPKELRVYGGSDELLYFVVGGAARGRAWSEFRPPLLGAVIVGALLNAETVPERGVVQGASAFARVYGLPEMTEALRSRRPTAAKGKK